MAGLSNGYYSYRLSNVRGGQESKTDDGLRRAMAHMHIFGEGDEADAQSDRSRTSLRTSSEFGGGSTPSTTSTSPTSSRSSSRTGGRRPEPTTTYLYRESQSSWRQHLARMSLGGNDNQRSARGFRSGIMCFWRGARREGEMRRVERGRYVFGGSESGSRPQFEEGGYLRRRGARYLDSRGHHEFQGDYDDHYHGSDSESEAEMGSEDSDYFVDEESTDDSDGYYSDSD